MLLNGKAILHLEESDLRELMERGEPERKTLEYKRDLPGGKDSEKKEFLADACSFANASGGFLIYGMEEDEGKPVGLPGIAGKDADAEKLRRESSVRDGIDPRIPGVQSHTVPLSSGNWVLVIEIPKSWASPHMVKYKGTSRFYARSTNGKYQMDVRDIRAAFVVSETLNQKLRSSRFDRLAKIEAGETPVALPDEPKVVLQVVPVVAFREPTAIDLQIYRSDQWAALRPLGASYSRFNFDGILVYQTAVHQTACGYEEGPPLYYLQLFRNGIVETVDAHLLRRDADPELYIRYDSLEDQVIPLIDRILRFQHHVGIEAPVLIFFSMLGVSGFKMPTGSLAPHVRSEVIDRNTLLFPEVWLDDYPADMRSLVESLRPVFDALWNATGFPRWETYQRCVQRLVR